MTEKSIGEKGVGQYPVCCGQLSPELVKTITSASEAIGAEMSPDTFREWLMDDTRDPNA